jgi:hypothetical protein
MRRRAAPITIFITNPSHNIAFQKRFTPQDVG